MMDFRQPLLQLPIRFDAEALAAEVRALPDSAWTPHPTGFAGNEAVLLVTPAGELSQGIEGAMGPTEHLRRCPYIMEVMSELGGVWGRSRLMGLAPGAEVPAHVDVNYYWRTHIRIHIPVITNPGVRFTCGDESVHMQAGDCWVFDSFRWHDVQNEGAARRIHLVLDTVGSESIWGLIEAAQAVDRALPCPKLRPGQRRSDDLIFEQVNVPRIMSPWEIRCHLDFLAAQAIPSPGLQPILRRLDRFHHAWGAAWAQYGASDDGIPAYRTLLAAVKRDLVALGIVKLALRNELQLHLAVDQLIFQMAIAPPAPPVSLSAVEAGGAKRLAS